jgi:asparagine synthase (glutamine-hydrolysing)
MCGICGVIKVNQDATVDPEILRHMVRTLIHRGPDDHGFYLDGPVGLGHRRLSIIDLTTGRQPIHNEDQSIWIVFNGEIYNSPELRERLEKAGHHFYTQSDTEVVVHAYEHYGGDCLNRLNGIFAFALWDRKNRRLLLARDRMGVKPLYYADLPGGFLFASELKALLAHPSVERCLDLTALNLYLSLEYVPSPHTIFADVKKLPPGHLLTLEKGRVTISSYWDIDLSQSEAGPRRSPAEYEGEFRDTLKEAVRLELLSDVPLGVLLSGGIDSSAVAAMMVQTSSKTVKSFTIAFDDPSFDESHHARQVAAHLGTEHHELTLDAGTALELVPRLGEFLDEPLGDSSFIPTFLLSAFTSRHVKVALGGDGGDELFGGYPTLQAHRLSLYYHHLLPQWMRQRLVPWVVAQLPVSFDNLSFDFRARRFLSGQSAPAAVRHHLWLGSFTPSEKRQLLGPLASGPEDEVEKLAMAQVRASRTPDILNQILYCDMKLYLEGDILPKVDRASMAHSLEVRVPLLNKLLLEFAARLPHQLKVRNFTTKYIMRRALKDILPASILKRGKKGFNMPVGKWLSGPLRPLAEDLLAEVRLKRAGLFNPAYVQSLLADHWARRRDNRKLLWTLLAFELWRDCWMTST